MNPRRLIAYAVVLLVLVGTYAGLRWRQAQEKTRADQAKQVFNFKEAEISAFSLKRGQEEIQLTRQGAAWEIAKPLKAKADSATVDNLLKALAPLKMERDLGPGDPKTFGLDPPTLVVSFTAKGEQHQLAMGSPAPGGRSVYARKDEVPNVLTITSMARDSLNQQLLNLRDKTLWAFEPGQVKSIKIRTDKTQVNLEKNDAGAWRWTGKPNFRLRPDRVAQLLRQLQEARISSFPPAPKDLKTTGLAPKAKTEVTLTTPQGVETLFLGTGTGNELYARLGTQGQVVRVNKDLPEQIAKISSSLEDRRLWTGSVAEVGKVVWGAPAKPWAAVREGHAWKVTGPDQAEIKHSPTRLEMALINLGNLEYSSLLPQTAAPGKESFAVEFLGVADKPMFRLEVIGKKGDGVEIRTKTGDATMTAVIPQKNLAQWQKEMDRLTTPPPSTPQPITKPGRKGLR